MIAEKENKSWFEKLCPNRTERIKNSSMTVDRNNCLSCTMGQF